MLRIIGNKRITLYEVIIILYPLLQFSYIKLLFDGQIIFDVILSTCMGIATLVSIANMRESFKFDKISMAFIVFTTWIIVTRMYSISEVYASEKIILFLRTGLFYFLVRNIVVNYVNSNSISLLKLFRLIMIINVSFILVYVTVNYSAIMQSVFIGARFETELANPIWLSRFICETMLGLLVLIKLKRCSRKWLVVFLPMILLVIISGSKGPILSLIIAYIMYIYISSQGVNFSVYPKIKNFFKTNRQLVGFGIILVFIILLTINFVPTEYLQSRFSSESVFSETEGLRYERYSETFDIIRDNFIFGVGLGGWPICYSGFDSIDYPHNIILELLSETGIIGVVLFTMIILAISQGLFKRDIEYKVIYTMLVFYLLNAMFSGDIASGNRGLFIYLGILSAMSLKSYEERAVCSSMVNTNI